MTSKKPVKKTVKKTTKKTANTKAKTSAKSKTTKRIKYEAIDASPSKVEATAPVEMPSVTPMASVTVHVSANAPVSGNIHYRRCHICNQVSESDNGRVHACGVCGKVMAPFFFFEDGETVTLSEFELRPFVSPGQHPPVRGLTAFW